MRSIALALVLSVVSSLSAAPRQRSVRARGWGAPGCASFAGLPNLFVSFDRGRSFTGNNVPAPASAPASLVILDDQPRVMMAIAGRAILESTDAGCSWTVRHTVEAPFQGSFQIAAGRGGKVLFWSPDVLVAYDRSRGGAAEWRMPETIVGFGADRNDPSHVRAIGVSGQGVWDSRDSGATWLRTGFPAGTTVANGAVNPTNLDHLVVATTGGSILTSRDGGSSWSLVPDLSLGANVCQILFSPANPSVVWILARNNADFLYRSVNGGSTFEALRLPTGVGSTCFRLVSHPRDANLVGLAAGGFFVVDASARTITGASCCGAPVADAAFSPDDPNTVYVFAAR